MRIIRVADVLPTMFCQATTVAFILVATLPQTSVAADKEPSSATEEPVKLETLTVTTDVGLYAETSSSAGSKVPMPIRDVPASVQIVNANFIGDLKALRLEDIYPYVIGMTRTSNEATSFNMRGFREGNNNPYGLQMDGMPGLGSRRGSPSTADVDRVEVLKGPSSVLYGQIAPGGIVNIVSKRPSEQASTSLFTSAVTYAGSDSTFGSDNGYIVTFDSTGPIDQAHHFLYRIISSYENTNSFRNGLYNHNTYLYPSFTYSPNSATSLTVLIDLIDEKRKPDNGFDTPFTNLAFAPSYTTAYDGPNDRYRDVGDGVSVMFDHFFENGWKVHFSGRSVWHRDDQFQLENDFPVNVMPVVNSGEFLTLRHNQVSDRYNFVDINIYGKLGSDNFKHTLLLGVSGGELYDENNRFAGGPDIAQPISIYNPVVTADLYPMPDPGTRADLKSVYHNTDVYFSDQMKVGKSWHFSAGARYEQQINHSLDIFNSGYTLARVHSLVPQAGMIFEVNDNVSLYASYSESFSANDTSVVDQYGNSNFPPETAWQVETGLKCTLLDHKLTMTFAAYDINKKNVLEDTGNTTPSGDPISILAGAQKAEGLEAQASWLPVKNWQVTFGGAYLPVAKTTKSSDPTLVDARLANDPKLSLSAWTRYNIPSGSFRGFGAGLGLIYVGSRIGGNSDPRLAVPGYTRLNTAFYYHWKHFDFSLNIDNIFDRKYIDSVANVDEIHPGEPRKLTFSIRTQF